MQIDTSTDLTAAMPITVEIIAFAERNSYFETEWSHRRVPLDRIDLVSGGSSAR